MPYLGNEPFTQYSETKTQVLTGDGTVGPYTLDYEVGSVGDVEVFVNNVRQQGGSSYAYTVSGNQLTMTGAVASTDDFYVVFQGKSTPSGQIPEKQSNGDYTFDDGTLFVDASTNRVGLNTSSPVRDLEVTGGTSGMVRVSGSTSGGLIECWDGTNGIYFGSDPLISGNGSSGDLAILTDTGYTQRFYVDGSERMRVTANGLTFNGDTAATNALDDYEEGTWTPSFEGSSTAGTGVYSHQKGRYTKVGNIVTAWFLCETSSFSSAPSGALYIKGLPFSSSSTDGWAMGSYMANDMNVDVSASTIVTSSLYMGNNFDYIRIYSTRDDTGWYGESINNEAFAIYGTITYRTG